MEQKELLYFTFPYLFRDCIFNTALLDANIDNIRHVIREFQITHRLYKYKYDSNCDRARKRF